MQQLFVGSALLLLALLVGIAAYVEFTGPGFGVDPYPMGEKDRVEFLDEAGTTVILENDRNPLIEAASEEISHPLLDEGIIPPWEKTRIDRDGYYNYRLRPHDTLSRIAQKYLGRASLWRVIMDHNPQILDPRDIRPGMVVRIPLWLRTR